MHGTAGQSFGAFAVSAMTLHLEGLANDFVGKGLCGGELILRGVGRAAQESAQHTLLGNVALYGATSGSLFAAGRAGERFAVRNSGALAIVEGVGDHGCEYMTGGLAVVLGTCGHNFGAGMTGGLAWIYDEGRAFLGKGYYHKGFIQPQTWDELDHAARASIRELVELHFSKTGSRRAEWLLANWNRESPKFVRMMPKVQA
jgi:glutamate synthase (NADPH/NADH) large chain